MTKYLLFEWQPCVYILDSDSESINTEIMSQIHNNNGYFGPKTLNLYQPRENVINITSN